MPIVKQCSTCGKEFSLTHSAAITRTNCSMACKAASMVVDNLPPKVGAWTILRRDETDVKRMVCRCDCGTERSMARINLYQGTTKSCGCIKRKRPDMSAKCRKDLTDKRFGKWLVISVRWEDQKGWALCRCDCGTEREVRAADLSHGNSQSCGCVSAEKAYFRGTHYGSDTPTYKVWVGMRKRCTNPNSEDYPLYGGRGVYVCDGWNDYAAFVGDVGERPREKLSIDRIDTNGAYTCGKCEQCKERGASMNVRWATTTQQGRNRRNTRKLTLNGETKTMFEWSEELNIGYSTLHSRINQHHWTPEEALTIAPVIGQNQRIRA